MPKIGDLGFSMLHYRDQAEGWMMNRGGGVPALVADILLDFVNGVYRVDGVSYGSASAAGFTGTGTFNASGYTPTLASDYLVGTTTIAGDYAAVASFEQTNVSGNVFQVASGGLRPSWSSGTGLYTVLPSPGGGISYPSSATKVVCARSGGNIRVCFDGGTVQGGNAIAAPGAGASVWVGNNAFLGDSWRFPIKSLAIYKQTLTDAQIVALGA